MVEGFATQIQAAGESPPIAEMFPWKGSWGKQVAVVQQLGDASLVSRSYHRAQAKRA